MKAMLSERLLGFTHFCCL